MDIRGKLKASSGSHLKAILDETDGFFLQTICVTQALGV